MTMTTLVTDSNLPIINPTIETATRYIVHTKHECRIQALENAGAHGWSFLSSLHYCQTGEEVLIFGNNDPQKNNDNEQSSLSRWGVTA